MQWLDPQTEWTQGLEEFEREVPRASEDGDDGRATRWVTDRIQDAY